MGISELCVSSGGYYDLHMENLKLFTNETTQTYVRLEQQVTASLNDVILSPENQKQVDNFITRVLEALVSISTDKNVELIDWPFIGGFQFHNVSLGDAQKLILLIALKRSL